MKESAPVSSQLAASVDMQQEGTKNIAGQGNAGFMNVSVKSTFPATEDESKDMKFTGSTMKAPSEVFHGVATLLGRQHPQPHPHASPTPHDA